MTALVWVLVACFAAGFVAAAIAVLGRFIVPADQLTDDERIILARSREAARG